MPRMLLLGALAAVVIGLVVVGGGSAGEPPQDRARSQPEEATNVPATPTDGPFAPAAARGADPTATADAGDDLAAGAHERLEAAARLRDRTREAARACLDHPTACDVAAPDREPRAGR